MKHGASHFAFSSSMDMPLCIADLEHTEHFKFFILGPRKMLRAGWKKSFRSVPYSIFGLMVRSRRLEILLKVMSHITPFLNWKIQLVLFICCHFFCDFCCQYSSECAASFQLCQFSKLQMRSFELLLLIETQRSSCSNCGAGMPLFSENIMNMTAYNGPWCFSLST